MNSYKEIIKFRKNKNNELTLVKESKIDLKARMNDLVKIQFSKIENEQRVLEHNYNISFLLQKINEFKNKIDTNNTLKMKLLSEINEYKEVILDLSRILT